VLHHVPNSIYLSQKHKTLFKSKFKNFLFQHRSSSFGKCSHLCGFSNHQSQVGSLTQEFAFISDTRTQTAIIIAAGLIQGYQKRILKQSFLFV